ncbi:MAG TPA: helix-turn-helix domain-containing protein [Candidatus Peribacteraceae bacterium]|nr:helix-turn-helix domain-containing protein [Candidatus Peribacteraceae bacterium]
MRDLTSGQAAELCSVAVQSINRWIDSGKLKGYRIPRSKHRRIPRGHLRRFMKDHGYPLEEDDTLRVLLVGCGVMLHARMQECLPRESELHIAHDVFAAGMLAVAHPPTCVVIDCAIGREQALHIAKSIVDRSLDDIVCIALLEREERSLKANTVFADNFRKPFDPDLLIERIQTLTGGRNSLCA